MDKSLESKTKMIGRMIREFKDGDDLHYVLEQFFSLPIDNQKFCIAYIIGMFETMNSPIYQKISEKIT